MERTKLSHAAFVRACVEAGKRTGLPPEKVAEVVGAKVEVAADAPRMNAAQRTSYLSHVVALARAAGISVTEAERRFGAEVPK